VPNLQDYPDSIPTILATAFTGRERAVVHSFHKLSRIPPICVGIWPGINRLCTNCQPSKQSPGISEPFPVSKGSGICVSFSQVKPIPNL
jgi:hypothetical protein